MSYYRYVLSHYRKSNNRRGQALAMTGIGEIYRLTGKPDEALSMHLGALRIRRQEDASPHLLAVSLHNVGEIYGLLGNSGRGLRYVHQGMALDRHHHWTNQLPSDYLLAGRLHQQLSNYDSAYFYFTTAKVLAQKFSLTPAYMQASLMLYEVHKKQGYTDSAIFYLEQYQNRYEEIFNENNTNHLQNLENSYQLYKQQFRYENLLKDNKQKELQIQLVVAVLFIIVIASIFAITLLVQQARINKLLHQRKLSEIAHLNAHEVRSPLAAILGLLSVLDKNNMANPENTEIVESLAKAAQQLDVVLHNVIGLVYDNKSDKHSKLPKGKKP